jgi:hypothetical protein
MKVDVYRNLHDDCLSVRSRETEDYGTVVSHEQKIHVRDAQFVVQQAGQQKARENGCKNVHAFVRGVWNEESKVLDGEPVTYDPFEYDHFVHAESEEPVAKASRTAVTTKGVYATGLEFLTETTK